MVAVAPLYCKNATVLVPAFKISEAPCVYVQLYLGEIVPTKLSVPDGLFMVVAIT